MRMRQAPGGGGIWAEESAEAQLQLHPNPDTKRAAVAMQAMWKEVGAIIDLNATEFKVHYKLLETRAIRN